VFGYTDSRGLPAVLLAVLYAGSVAAGATWTADQTGSCALETGDIIVFDGYQDTGLKLSLTETGLLVRTKSNIDMSYDDVGLAVDGGRFIPADAVVDEQDVLFSRNSDTIIEQFIRGGSVKLFLRFWPTYPATQRREARFSLMGFTRAYNDYKECRNKPPA